MLYVPAQAIISIPRSAGTSSLSFKKKNDKLRVNKSLVYLKGETIATFPLWVAWTSEK